MANSPGWDDIDKSKFFLVGAICSTGVRALMFPPTTIKVRQQVMPDSPFYQTFSGSLRHIIKHEGISGLFKGFVPSMMGVPVGQLYLSSYEIVRLYMGERLPHTRTGQLLRDFTAGAAATALAQTCGVPIDIVTQRLQANSSPLLTRSVFGQLKEAFAIGRGIVRERGIRGLYSGYLLQMMQYAPASGLWWFVYNELVRRGTITVAVAHQMRKDSQDDSNNDKIASFIKRRKGFEISAEWKRENDDEDFSLQSAASSAISVPVNSIPFVFTDLPDSLIPKGLSGGGWWSRTKTTTTTTTTSSSDSGRKEEEEEGEEEKLDRNGGAVISQRRRGNSSSTNSNNDSHMNKQNNIADKDDEPPPLLDSSSSSSLAVFSSVFQTIFSSVSLQEAEEAALHLQTWEIASIQALSAACAALILTTLTQPIDVIRTRVQVMGGGKHAKYSFFTLLRDQGLVRAAMKGLGSRLVASIPSSVLMILYYEFVKRVSRKKPAAAAARAAAE